MPRRLALSVSCRATSILRTCRNALASARLLFLFYSLARTILERKTWSCELQAHALLTCAFYFEPSRAGAVLIRIGCGGRFYFEPSHAGAVLIRIGCGGRVVLPALYCQLMRTASLLWRRKHVHVFSSLLLSSYFMQTND